MLGVPRPTLHAVAGFPLHFELLDHALLQDPDRHREREGVEPHKLEEDKEHSVILSGPGGDSDVTDARREGWDIAQGILKMGFEKTAGFEMFAGGKGEYGGVVEY